MHLISSFNSLTTFNYSPHFIITTNRRMWGTFEYILPDTRRPILSECKLHTAQLQSVAAGCGHYRHAIVAKRNIYLKKSQALRCQADEGFRNIIHYIQKFLICFLHFRRKKVPHVSVVHETAIHTAKILLL